MRIALLGHLHGFGGAEKSLIMLANQLVERGHSVELVSFTSDVKVRPLDERVKYTFIPDVDGNKIKRLIGRYKNLDVYLKNNKPDVAVSFWFQLAIFAMFASKKYNFQVIYSERGDPKDIEYNGLNGVIRSLFLPLVDGFVFQTNGAKKCFSSNIQKKSTVIHNAIEINKDQLVDVEKSNTIISVGRLHRQKNFSVLIKAMGILREDFPSYILEIYGEGELRKTLQSEIDSLGLHDTVKLMGNTKQIYEKMQKSEVFALTSDFEGMPNVLMEAMALGLPCVTTDCSPGGARELIDDQFNGIIVPVGDYIAVAEAIKYCLNDKKSAAEMGKNAAQILKTHSCEQIYNQWEDYIVSLCNTRKRRGTNGSSN